MDLLVVFTQAQVMDVVADLLSPSALHGFGRARTLGSKVRSSLFPAVGLAGNRSSLLVFQRVKIKPKLLYPLL